MARNRVEITGINTSELVPITNEKMMELLPLAQNGNDEARDELVHGNIKLVLSVVKKFNNRKENLDDIFQVGFVVHPALDQANRGKKDTK